VDTPDLVAELRTLVAGQHGESPAMSALAARTLELALVVQQQGEKIDELKIRLDHRSR
jgi:hypothetical protein